jgi:mannitol-1-/sugar-/sorbitol-6-phosphatase
MITFSCSAILFDLDGVLVDSTHAVAQWWRVWAAEKNVEPEKVLKIMHGRRTIEVIRLAAPHLDAEAEAKYIEQRAARNDDHRDGVTVMPGAPELLQSLPEDRWGIVTSGTRVPATARLRFVGLPVPRVLVTADDVVRGKPDPEPYLKGAQLLGVDSAQCLVIEDAPLGIQSAHAGGMKVIGIASTYPASELHEADAVVSALQRIRVSLQDGRLRVEV